MDILFYFANQFVTIGIVFFLIFIMWLVWLVAYHYNRIDVNGYKMDWFGGSDANPAQVIDGHRWTPISKLKKWSNKNRSKAQQINMNMYRVWDVFQINSKMPNLIRKRLEKNEIFYDASETAKGVLAIGSAGSGKTEWINTIINQDFYRKAIIFSKKGDFEKFFYRPGIDILVNPKIEGGIIHDILSEPIQYIELYIESIMNSVLGKSQNYFSGSARQKLEGFLETVKVKEYDTNLTVKEKWEMFLNLFEEAFEDATEGEQNSEKDILSTTKATMLKGLYLLAYRIIDGAPTFTAKDFFEQKEIKNKIFLNSTDPSMDSLLAATTAVLIKYQLAMPDTKTYDPSFNVAYFMDEYFSLDEIMPAEIMSEVSRVGRSKGICPFKLLQNLPEKMEDKIRIVSNVQYILLFAGTDNSTLDYLQKFIGKVEFNHHKKNLSMSSSGKSWSFSDDKKAENIFSNYQINTLQKEGYSHVFFAPKDGLLYKAYQPPVNLRERKYLNLNEIEMVGYYKWKNAREEARKEIKRSAALEKTGGI